MLLAMHFDLLPPVQYETDPNCRRRQYHSSIELTIASREIRFYALSGVQQQANPSFKAQRPYREGHPVFPARQTFSLRMVRLSLFPLVLYPESRFISRSLYGVEFAFRRFEVSRKISPPTVRMADGPILAAREAGKCAEIVCV